MSDDSIGIFIYGFIDECECKNLGIKGIRENSYVYTINYKDIAAAVSDEPLKTYVPYDKDIESFKKVIDSLMNEYTVIPVVFGTIARNENSIYKLLEENYEVLKALIEKFKGKVEMGLKVFWNQQGFLDDIETEEIKKMKEEMMNKEITYMEKAALGEKVEHVVNLMRDKYKREIFDKLLYISKDAKFNDNSNPKMILNAAFLIDKKDKRYFDELVDKLYIDNSNKMIFKYSGPWPPYNFVQGLSFKM